MDKDKKDYPDKFYDFPSEPVPKDHRKSSFNISMVTTGMAVAMSTLYTGANLASVMTFKEAIQSVLIGCVILFILASITGSIGANEGVSFSILARFPFGRFGSKIVGLIFATSMLGWFAYQAGYFGETINILAPDSFLTSVKVATLWGGILMMSTAIVGYKGMTFLSYMASPLILVLCIYGGYIGIRDVGLDSIMANVPDNPQSLGYGITIVVGGWITGAILQPDISRYAKKATDNILGVFIAMIIFSIANIGGVIIAKATSASNVMEGLVTLGMGTVALLIVILGQWTSNDNNLYSASLGIINIKPSLNKHVVSATSGVIFTIVAILGVQNYFVDFLNFLGTFLPPFGAVLITDYYFLDNKDNYEFTRESTYPKVNYIAFLSVLIGGIVAFSLRWGSAAINSIIVTSIVYYLLMKFRHSWSRNK